MSRRKGAQRYQDLLDDLASISNSAVVTSSVDEEQETSPKETPRNAFSFLNAGQNQEEAQNDPEDHDTDQEESTQKQPTPSSAKRKKKKKKKLSTVNAEVDSSPTPPVKSTPDKKTAKSIKKDKGVELDELDQAIQEIKIKYGDEAVPATVASAGSSSVSTGTSLRSLLSVETRFLDAEAELRRFFGSRVVKSDQTKRPKGRVVRKTLLCNPQDHWPRAQGLGMDLIETKDGASYFTFTHNNNYKQIEYQFFQCVSSYDPNTLSSLLQVYPYHVDCLLQLSDVAKQQGDATMAAEFIERALYSFERSFHPMFNIAAGNCRLDFRHMESRPFYLAIHRHIQFIQRRGCWRTSFEFCRLLLGLDPDNDPYAALLSIDFYALKAKKYDFLLKMASIWKASDLEKYPNLAYSTALAKFLIEQEAKEGHEESQAMMVSAIARYPMVISPLYEKAGLSVDPYVATQDEFIGQFGYQPGPTTPLHLIANIYAERANALYKDPDLLPWLTSAVAAALQVVQKSPASHADNAARKRILATSWKDGIDINLCRHVIVADLPPQPFSSFLPPSIMSSGASLMSYDPLPPKDSISGYDDDLGGGMTQAGLQSQISGLLRMFRGGGGGQMPLEDRDRMIEELTALAAATNGGEMPGGFRAEHVETAENHEEPGQANAEAGAGWLGGLRSALSRWVGSAEPEREDVDENENENAEQIPHDGR